MAIFKLLKVGGDNGDFATVTKSGPGARFDDPEIAELSVSPPIYSGL